MRYLIILVVLVLTACASTSGDLRSSGARYDFPVSRGYQQTYRAISEELRRCMQFGAITATYVVQSELYTDIRKGVITQTLQGGFGVDVLAVIEVVGVEDTASDVTVFVKRDSPGFVDKLKAVAVDVRQFCPL